MATSFDLRRKTALVTGASSGIGRAVAEVLARDVATLVLVARRRDRLDELAKELHLKHPALRVRVHDVDLTDRVATAAMLDALDEEGLAIDVLVNNAGFGDRGLLDTRPWSKLEALLELNVVSATFLIHRLLPPMIARGSGAILNVGSTAGIVSKPGSAVYGASKSYLNSLSEALHSELAGTGVVVTALLPGPVPTEFGDMALKADAAPVGSSASPPADVPRRDPIKVPKIFTVSAEACAEQAVAALGRGQARVIPGASVRAMAGVLENLPKVVLRSILARAAKKMRA
jgi:short-subunit dehydrogenase